MSRNNWSLCLNKYSLIQNYTLHSTFKSYSILSIIKSFYPWVSKKIAEYPHFPFNILSTDKAGGNFKLA